MDHIEDDFNLRLFIINTGNSDIWVKEESLQLKKIAKTHVIVGSSIFLYVLG